LNDDRTRREAAPPVGPNTLPSAAMAVPLGEGTILAGKYRVERVLGRGGMGVVVAATHLELEQRVALKFLLPEAMESPEVVERFAREARSAVKIESEHVARVIDVGKLENGLPYMVMEHLQGRDLAATLADYGMLSIADTAEYVLQACEAIAQAHALGIVHRDLKPANLFLIKRPDGTMSIKVLDFGISKVSLPAASPAEMSLTRTTDVMGSPTYMSPEQMRASRDVDPRTDIWALGIILYELLTGDTPFEGNTMPELCAAILKEPPSPVRDRRPEVPVELEAAILRCLEKDPAKRFGNVAELAAALVDFAPKRARLSAERSARILKGAGIQLSSLPPLLSNPPRMDAAPVAASTAGAWSRAEPKGEVPKSAPLSRAAKGAMAAVLVLAAGSVGMALRSRSQAPAVTAAGAQVPAVATAVPPAAPPGLTTEKPSLGSAAIPTPVSAASAAPEVAADVQAGSARKAEVTPIPAVKPRAKASATPAPPPKEPPLPQPPPVKKNPLNIDIK
jgi:eukaryotic-like serine/threonine-protein kinase